MVQDADNPIVTTVQPKDGTTTSSSSNQVPYRKQQQQSVPTPTKSPTKFGKANPIRDSIIFCIFIGILMFLTSDYDKPTATKIEDLDVKNEKKNITAILYDLATAAANKRRKDPCSMFVYIGSIPNTGYSYFAGQNYEIGDILIEDILSFVHEDMILSSSALILKHHPTLYNAVGTLYNNNSHSNMGNVVQVRASKNIQIGDEIFVPYDPMIHHLSIYNHIPQINDYSHANDIVQDALRSVYDHKTRDGRNICSMTPVMHLLKRSISRFHPIIASILPVSSTTSKLFRHHTPSIAILRNQTLLNLQQCAYCVDDTKVIYDMNGFITSTLIQRNVQAGQVIATVPLYLKKIPMESIGECHIEQDCIIPNHQQCFDFRNISLTICPLGLYLEQINHITDVENIMANVKYQWSIHRNVPTFEMNHQFAESSAVYAWDVIALRDISKGEKVRVLYTYFPIFVYIHTHKKHSTLLTIMLFWSLLYVIL